MSDKANPSTATKRAQAGKPQTLWTFQHECRSVSEGATVTLLMKVRSTEQPKLEPCVYCGAAQPLIASEIDDAIAQAAKGLSDRFGRVAREAVPEFGEACVIESLDLVRRNFGDRLGTIRPSGHKDLLRHFCRHIKGRSQSSQAAI